MQRGESKTRNVRKWTNEAKDGDERKEKRRNEMEDEQDRSILALKPTSYGLMHRVCFLSIDRRLPFCFSIGEISSPLLSSSTKHRSRSMEMFTTDTNTLTYTQTNTPGEKKYGVKEKGKTKNR